MAIDPAAETQLLLTAEIVRPRRRERRLAAPCEGGRLPRRFGRSPRARQVGDRAARGLPLRAVQAPRTRSAPLAPAWMWCGAAALLLVFGGAWVGLLAFLAFACAMAYLAGAAAGIERRPPTRLAQAFDPLSPEWERAPARDDEADDEA